MTTNSTFDLAPRLLEKWTPRPLFASKNATTPKLSPAEDGIPDCRATWGGEAHRDLFEVAFLTLRGQSTTTGSSVGRNSLLSTTSSATLAYRGPFEELCRLVGDSGRSVLIDKQLVLARDTSSGWVAHSPSVAHYLRTCGDEDQKRR